MLLEWCAGMVCTASPTNVLHGCTGGIGARYWADENADTKVADGDFPSVAFG